MANIGYVLFFSLIGGIVSLIGGFLLLANRKRAKTLSVYATPFAAGALLAAAFVDLLGEASHKGNIERALIAVMIGILAFFFLERFLHWFHHHHEHRTKNMDPRTPLIVVGDTVHNFIDGIAIAAGFLVDVPTGIIVTLAVAAHEIPQEIGDFGLLLHKGMARKTVILVNIASALATTVAAVIFFQLGQSVEIPLDIVLGFVAGFFIYIAVSDIIPSIHKNEGNSIAGLQSFLLVAGVVVVSVVTSTLHHYIDQGHESEHGAESSLHEAHEDEEEHHDEKHEEE